MKTIAIALVSVALTGCGSMKGQFENRASCTLDGKQMLVASMYGPIGVASKISAADAAVVCAAKVAP